MIRWVGVGGLFLLFTHSRRHPPCVEEHLGHMPRITEGILRFQKSAWIPRRNSRILCVVASAHIYVVNMDARAQASLVCCFLFDWLCRPRLLHEKVSTRQRYAFARVFLCGSLRSLPCTVTLSVPHPVLFKFPQCFEERDYEKADSSCVFSCCFHSDVIRQASHPLKLFHTSTGARDVFRRGQNVSFPRLVLLIGQAWRCELALLVFDPSSRESLQHMKVLLVGPVEGCSG